MTKVKFGGGTRDRGDLAGSGSLGTRAGIGR